MRYACVLALVLLFPVEARSADFGHIQQCFTSVLPGQIAILDRSQLPVLSGQRNPDHWPAR
jgi:hypothetical protein